MKRISVILAVVGLVASLAFAQSNSGDKPVQKSGSPMMMCPMMGAKSNMSMAQMMQGAPERMTGMFALTSEEIVQLLADKKTALGLSDAQVKEIADLIASSQQQKAREKMKSMMGQMEAGMKCPCMQGGPK